MMLLKQYYVYNTLSLEFVRKMPCHQAVNLDKPHRFDCWSYHPQLKKWSFLTNLPHGRTLIFPAITTDDDKRNLFLAGGRL